MSGEANVILPGSFKLDADALVLDQNRDVIGHVIGTSEDEPLPPEGSLADGPRPKRRFNARTRHHVLVKPDARKARNKAQRQARKRSRA